MTHHLYYAPYMYGGYRVPVLNVNYTDFELYNFNHTLQYITLGRTRQGWRPAQAAGVRRERHEFRVESWMFNDLCLLPVGTEAHNSDILVDNGHCMVTCTCGFESLADDEGEAVAIEEQHLVPCRI